MEADRPGLGSICEASRGGDARLAFYLSDDPREYFPHVWPPQQPDDQGKHGTCAGALREERVRPVDIRSTGYLAERPFGSRMVDEVTEDLLEVGQVVGEEPVGLDVHGVLDDPAPVGQHELSRLARLVPVAGLVAYLDDPG